MLVASDTVPAEGMSFWGTAWSTDGCFLTGKLVLAIVVVSALKSTFSPYYGCYLADENGKADFYFIDKTDGSISLYRFADKRAELLYSYLFDVFLVIAIIEAVIITVTTYIVRRMVSDRTNPRPKRV